MFLRTLPGRIIAGFVLVIALAVILGVMSLWRIMEINDTVDAVATNSVPSIVTLNRVIQSTYDCNRAVRRMLLTAADRATPGPVDDSAFVAARAVGDKACGDYAALLSDAEDERLFGAATAARTNYFRTTDRVVSLLKEGKADEARTVTRVEVDPLLDAATGAFNETVAHNVSLAAQKAEIARTDVNHSFVMIGGTLALATLLATLLAVGIIRSATRALGGVSESLELSAAQTSLAAAQLSSSSHALAEGCSEQGSAVEETSAALEQMSAMIRATADNADKAKHLANHARDAAQTGLGTMQEMNDAMHAIEASSQEVAKIVKNIDEIAFQTNILALNAAVEAARAGEAGAGFAVVADEVRSLAQRSAAAARETAAKIEAAIADSRRGAVSCERVGEALGQIAQKVTAADGLVAEIATAAKEQAQGIRQVTAAMTQMDQVTQGNSASAEQSAGAAEELKGQAHVMGETVMQLRMLAGGRTHRQVRVEAATPTRQPQRLERTGGRPPARPARIATAIPMPKESLPAADHEDEHFKNF